LAFLFHTVLELLEPRWRAIRRRCLAPTPPFSIWQCLRSTYASTDVPTCCAP
jgi:hypothetical protein